MVFQLRFLKVGINFMSAGLLGQCLQCRSQNSLVVSQFNRQNRAAEKDEERKKEEEIGLLNVVIC